MSLFTQKITLFLILGLAIIGLGIPYALYASRRDVTGMTVGFLIVAMLVAVAVVALDRLAVRFVAPGWLSGIELAMVVVALVLYARDNRTVTLDLTNNPSPYFVVIWTKAPPETPVAETRFLLSKTIAVPVGTVVQLDQALFSALTVKGPTNWAGQYSFGIDLPHPRFASAYFYGPETYNNKRADVDRLIRQAVAAQ